MNEKISQLSKNLLKIKNKKDMEDFLGFILTKRELLAVIKRIKILAMLQEGVPQREIAKKVEVGIATVTHGSRELNSKKESSSIWRDFKRWRLA